VPAVPSRFGCPDLLQRFLKLLLRRQVTLLDLASMSQGSQVTLHEIVPPARCSHTVHPATVRRRTARAPVPFGPFA